MAKFHGKHYYLGAWSYAFLDQLYLIPIVGLIFLIIHAFNTTNENLRHYARSYFARFVLWLGIAAVLGVIVYLAGGQQAFTEQMNELFRQIGSWRFVR